MTGIINVIKPPNMTSQDVVSYLRGLLNERRIGHGGTLDPDASGVLPVFLGKATRLSEYSIQGDKEYLGEIAFGASTDTQDSYGTVLARSDRLVSFDEARDALSSFVGEIHQRAPMYSAIKVGGEKLYRIVRSGKKVEAPLRRVIIHQAQVLRGIAPNRFLFLVRCGKGTYIRALCNDVGKELGCPSYLSFLLRTEVGVFNLKNGHTLDEIRRYKERDAIDAFILPADYAVMHLPKIALAGSAQERLRHGAPVSRREVLCDDSQGQEQISRIYIEGRFVGLGMIARDGIRMNKVILEDHHENLG